MLPSFIPVTNEAPVYESVVSNTGKKIINKIQMGAM